MYNPFSLEGKTILITGASSGIGKCTAIECSKLGAKLILTGRNNNRLNETFEQLEGIGHSTFSADLSNESEIDILVRDMPEIDGLVNNAGIVKTLPFQYIKPDDMNSIFTVNFFSPVSLSQKLLITKKIKKQASIVFVSSIDGPITSHIGNSIYSASKGAITAMARNMAVELASKKIRVNSVLPGMVETPLINNNHITSEQLKEDMRLYPLKRYGKPSEIAYAIIYLLSDASNWTTGSNLVVDGGFSLL